VLLVLRYYGGQMVKLRRFAVPGMLLPAVGSTGISYISPLIVAALIGRFAARGTITVGEAVPCVLAFAGVQLASEVLWRVGLHCMNRLDGHAIEQPADRQQGRPPSAPGPAAWSRSAPARGPDASRAGGLTPS
jgi:ATP-binding cassette subfamily B protein